MRRADGARWAVAVALAAVLVAFTLPLCPVFRPAGRLSR